MRSIERRFNAFKNKNQDLSTYTNFARAITSQHFSKNQINKWFNKLVEKEEYEKKDKKKLIKHLANL